MILLDYPSLVRRYIPFFTDCFSEAGLTHFQKALSGFMVGENKTIQGINRMFVGDERNQSSLNRFFTGQPFDLEEVNKARLKMLHSIDDGKYKAEGTLSLDNTLLKHYGKRFDDIYYHYDYVHRTYRYAHDLVTLHYSDEKIDYPLEWTLWSPPDWEVVAEHIQQLGKEINEDKWNNRHQNTQAWRNYMRARYKTVAKTNPTLKETYETKNDLAKRLLSTWRDKNPEANLPVTMDCGFSSADLCLHIKSLGLDYVASMREDRRIQIPSEKTSFRVEQLIEELRSEDEGTPKTRKYGYVLRGKKVHRYIYEGSYKIKDIKKKQRVLISFTKEDLSDRPAIHFTNRLDWSPASILRIRDLRWPIETYHQEGKAEGLESYQVRRLKGVQTHIAIIVVAYSMLQCATHDQAFLKQLQQRLQLEPNGTLAFMRRLMKTEGLLTIITYLINQFANGNDYKELLPKILGAIAYH